MLNKVLFAILVMVMVQGVIGVLTPLPKDLPCASDVSPNTGGAGTNQVSELVICLSYRFCVALCSGQHHALFVGCCKEFSGVKRTVGLVAAVSEKAIQLATATLGQLWSASKVAEGLGTSLKPFEGFVLLYPVKLITLRTILREVKEKDRVNGCGMAL
ncbi:hypothetical protein B0H14DRAFT_2602444 [Mycena olivaceomarginata]|nr:hypothetical protein B0H14DRAFT_2602444 [Mycena olivaceomarginata]